jgi:hypothetical protein
VSFTPLDLATEATQADALTNLQSVLVAAQNILTALTGTVEVDSDALGLQLDTLNASLTALLTVEGTRATSAKQDNAQTTLSSLLSGLGATADASSASTLVGLLKAVKASLAATVVVDFPAGATPTPISDTATATAARYIGITVHETSGTASAVVRIRNQNVSGTILDVVSLLPNESVSLTYPRGRAAASGTIFVQVASGAVEGSVFT